MMKSLIPRSSRSRQLLLLALASTSLLTFWACRDLLRTTWTLVSLPFIWPHDAAQYMLSREADDFDVTFANYSTAQDTAGSPYEDVVPPVLHHIALGGGAIRPVWENAMQACLEWHPGWESHLWTDKNARNFVAERFPEMLSTWDGYPYFVQRVDALRYMVLYEYGGVILDMDLKCKRSLGPLRRFDFVAPAANPTGFSVGFMMASKNNQFVRRIVQSLATYDRHWFGLPYPTVMFSTGCHFASTIHALQPHRADLKILAGPESNPNMHRLSGPVSTPLFDHLGSSSWHGYDASLVRRLGRVFHHPLLILFGFVFASWVVWRKVRARALTKWRMGRQGKSLGDADDRV